MSEKRLGTVAVTGRLSYPKVWKKEASVEGGPLKYSMNLLFDPDTTTGENSIAVCEKEVAALATRTWKEKGAKVLKNLEKNRLAFLPGEKFTNDEGDVYQGYEGMMALKVANGKEFKRLARDKSILTEEEADRQNLLYAGCYVDAVVSFYAITDQARGGNGIFATIEVLRHRKDGEAFGAPPVDEDDYLDDLDEDDEDDLI